MKLPELTKVKIIKKYKMFFIDALNETTGEIITAYTKNKGGFREEMSPGKYVYVSTSSNPNRKTKYSVELIEQQGILTGVDPNLGAKLLSEYFASTNQKLKIIQKEVTVEDSRLDLKLLKGNLEGFGEIKSVFTFKNHQARFPEAPTPRGLKHLNLLTSLAKKNIPTYLFYIVQVPQVSSLVICKDIDPEYAQGMKKAKKAGVQIIALQCSISLKEIKILKELTIDL